MANDVTLKLRITDEGTVEVLDRAGRKLDELGGKAGSAGSAFTRTGAAIVTFNQTLDLLQRGAHIAQAAFNAFLDPISKLDRLGELSKITTMSARDLSALGVVAQQSGTSLEGFAQMMGLFSTKIVEAQDKTSTTSKLFRALGVDVEKTGSDVTRNLGSIATAINALPDSAEKGALERALFGRSGAQSAAFFSAISGGISDVRVEVEKLRGVVGDDAVKAADKFNDDLVLMRALMDGLKEEIAIQFLPAAQGAVTTTLEWSAANRGLMTSGFTDYLTSVIETAKAVAPVVLEIASAVNAVAGGIADAIAFAAIGGTGSSVRMHRRALTQEEQIALGNIRSNSGLKSEAELRGTILGPEGAAGMSLYGGASEVPAGTAIARAVATATARRTKEAEATIAAIRKAMAEGKGGAKDKQPWSQEWSFDEGFDKAFELRAKTGIDAAKQQLDYATEHNAALDDQVALFDKLQGQERALLEYQRDSLASQIAFRETLGDSAGETQLLEAQLEAIRADIGALPLAARDFGEELRKANTITVDLGDSLTSGLKSTFQALLTGGRTDISSLLTATGQKMGVDMASGLLDSLLSGKSFSVKSSPMFDRIGDRVASLYNRTIGSGADTFGPTGASVGPPEASAAGASGGGGIGAAGYIAIAIAAARAAEAAFAGAKAVRDSVASRTYGTGLISGRDVWEGAVMGATKSLGIGLVGKQIAKNPWLGWAIGMPLESILYYTGFFKAPTVEKQLATQVEEQFKNAGLLNAQGISQPRAPGERVRWDKAPNNNQLTEWGYKPGDIVRVHEGGDKIGLAQWTGSELVVPDRSRELNAFGGPLSAFALAEFGTENNADSRWVNAFINRARQLGYNRDQAEADFQQIAAANNITRESLFSKVTGRYINEAAERDRPSAGAGMSVLNAQADVAAATQYRRDIVGIATLFAEDLPAGVDAAQIAIDSMTEDLGGKFVVNVEKANEALTKQIEIFGNLEQSLAGAAGGGIGSVWMQAFDGGSASAPREGLAAGLHEAVFGTVQSIVLTALEATPEYEAMQQSVAALAHGNLSATGGVTRGIASILTFATANRGAMNAASYAFLPDQLGGMAGGFADAASAARRSLLSPRRQRGALLGEIGGLDAKISGLLADGVISDSEAGEFQSLLGRRGGLGSSLIGLGGKRNVQLGASVLDATAELAKKGQTLVERQNVLLARLNWNFERFAAYQERGEIREGMSRAAVLRGPTGRYGIDPRERAQRRDELMGRR